MSPRRVDVILKIEAGFAFLSSEKRRAVVGEQRPFDSCRVQRRDEEASSTQGDG